MALYNSVVKMTLKQQNSRFRVLTKAEFVSEIMKAIFLHMVHQVCSKSFQIPVFKPMKTQKLLVMVRMRRDIGLGTLTKRRMIN